MVNLRTELMGMNIEVVRMVIKDKKNITREVAKELGEKWPLQVGWKRRIKRRFNVVGVKKKKSTDKKKSKQNSKSFYKSHEWAKLRYKALKLNDGKCECCGRGKHEGAILHADHIKSIRTHPKLKLKLSNIQILCNTCNWGKGSFDDKDWREPSLRALMGEDME